MISRYLTNMMIAPHQSPVSGDPADHGLENDDVSCDTRLVQIRHDPWANTDFIQRIYDALEVDDKDLVWLDITKGRAAAFAHLGDHTEQILD